MDFDFSMYEENNDRRPTNSYRKHNYKKRYNKNKYNLWNKNSKIEAKELDPSKFKEDVKYFTVAIPISASEINNDDLESIKLILNRLKAKDYKCRSICGYSQAIQHLIDDTMKDNCYIIAPWKSFCKHNKNIRIYQPTDKNIELAAYYVKNFHKLKAGIKALKSALFTTLFGLYNNEPSMFVLTYDPHYNNRKIDFKASKFISDYYILRKPLDLTIFNLYNKKDRENLIDLLS